MSNYWIFKVTSETGGLFGRTAQELFDHRTKEEFWPIRELSEDGKRENKIDLLRKGDKAVFYAVGKNSGRFVGTCVLASDYTRLTEEQAAQVVHKEYIDSEQGVFIEKVDRWAKPLPADYLRRKEILAQKGTAISVRFRGYIKKLKRPEEYYALLQEHELYF
ncbi:MAG: EVE domain-containing protein [Candidatus Bathyarchaeota archaeon]|nr:EVE domain-containing protein [Candidatus Bathyarchaeota archaeon]